ncbi:GNAT family N-acetyltransferase [Leifsonia sp. C5G2]|nr:GNAT family N-acetyltransferase [Leifsonia sp. C5G2]NUU05648.1 GNAT family N-acetyltransferase [Leifsonia sp. C5G2]
MRESAVAAARRGTAVTWVWAPDGAVIAYYTLSAHVVQRDDVPARIGRGGPREIPSVLIGKLALDSSLHGRGMGEVLVADALSRVLAATQVIGAKLVVVDALSDAVAGFYERLGFVRIPSSLRLVQRITDIEAASTGTSS